MFKGFQKPKRLVANTETLTDRFGQFTAQPFQRGFGTTIGNSLRRVLLSSIEGAAITAVKIEGVTSSARFRAWSRTPPTSFSTSSRSRSRS